MIERKAGGVIQRKGESDREKGWGVIEREAGE